MALPLSLPSGPRRIANYLPICGPHIKCLRDFAPGVVVVSIRAHPRQLLDILAIQIHFSTTYPFLIPPLPLVLILNPGIHMGGKNIHQRSPIPDSRDNPSTTPSLSPMSPGGSYFPPDVIYVPGLSNIPPPPPLKPSVYAQTPARPKDSLELCRLQACT